MSTPRLKASRYGAAEDQHRPLYSRWYCVNGARLHVRASAGSSPRGAPPVVLVHAIGLASAYLVPTGELLAPHCPVYIPDLPGFGLSDRPTRTLTLEELSDTLVAWMNTAGLERASFLGNSFGAQIVVDLAARYPERVEKLVLVAPSIDRHHRRAAQQVLRLALDAPLERASLKLLSLRDYVRAGPSRLVRTLQFALADRIECKLPFVQAPTLVVRGSRDPVVPQDWAEEVTRRLRNAQLEVIPGAGHIPNYSRPHDLARLALPFLLHQDGCPESRD